MIEEPHRRRRWWVIGLWLGALIGWRVYAHVEDVSLVHTAQRFVDETRGHWWGGPAYVGVYMLRSVFMLPASVLSVVGGIIFGSVRGIVFTMLATNASAALAFWLGRTMGRGPVPERRLAPDARPVTERPSTNRRRGMWTARLRERSFESVMITRLTYMPYDLVSYTCGYLRVEYPAFALGTAIGTIPGTVSFVLLGSSLDRIEHGPGIVRPGALVASVLIAVISLVVAQVLRRRWSGAATTRNARP